MIDPALQNNKGYSVQLEVSNPRRNEICDFLDAFNNLEKFCEINPSTLVKGGWYAMQKENRVKNLDWMAQSAHSFREIHYGLKDTKSIFFLLKRFIISNAVKFFKYKVKNTPKNRKDKISDSLKTYIAEEVKRQEISKAMNKVHIAFTKIAHHFTEKDSLKDTLKILTFLKINQTSLSGVEYESYDKLVDTFENLILDIKPKGLLSHKIIDDIIANKTLDDKIIRSVCFSGGNPDTKRYFFSKADETWLKWIWDKGFFNQLKKPVLNTISYSYRLSELEYLTRMVEKEPQLVADIILSIPISKDTFNPEVVDRFFWITGLLPTKQIKTILPKILNENWVKLMTPFSRSGYEYQKIVEKLEKSGDYESLLILLEIILEVRQKEDFTDSERFSLSDKWFYLQDISVTGIFDAILNKKNNKKEEILKIFLNTLTKIVELGKEREETVFDKTEPFYLLDVDIFTLELDTDKRSHSREDIQNFIASYKELIRDVVGETCGDETKAKKIFSTYIETLPDSLTCWRLKLYAITRCPNVFKKEIEESLFRVFNVGERYFEIEGGAEYHQGLISVFGTLDDEIQRSYVNKVCEYFGANIGDTDKEVWRKRDGLEILTYIKKYLTPTEIIKSEAVFGKISEDSAIIPHPAMGEVRSGIITNKTPFNPAELTIQELINHLKTDATAEALNKKYKDDDFFSPRGVEGLGDAIKEDFKVRKTEYLKNINKFFERDIIEPAYVYSLLRQIEDMFRAKEYFSEEEILQILNFFFLIQKSGEVKEFEKVKDKSYWADWITVHKSMADILLEILVVIKDNQTFKDNRAKILSLVKYLLSIKSSPDVEDGERESGEPSSVAINSVRGQAFRAFVQFTYNDGNKALSGDVKALYEHIIDTDTSNAIRFSIGQFLASFYFRDIEFIKGLLHKIFPTIEAGEEKLYFSSWEGYLSSSLYKELFIELESYYEYAIKVNPKSYPNRKYSKSLDETLAVHIALAYAHFDFKISDKLFKLFWNTPNENRHYEFVSFLGRTCLTRSQAGDDWFRENNVSKEKLIEFWNWIISTDIPIESKTFSGFGFWINRDKEVIDDKIVIKNLVVALEKSEGDVDWDYGLIGRIKKFAEIDPENTLDIIKRFLLLGDGLNSHRKTPLFSLDREIKEALEIIYKNGSLNKKVEDLINLLIEKGSSVFWGLKDILK